VGFSSLEERRDNDVVGKNARKNPEGRANKEPINNGPMKLFGFESAANGSREVPTRAGRSPNKRRNGSR
jgi:hypothetical protein